MTTERKPRWLGRTQTEIAEFSKYRGRGGKLDFNAWVRNGKPSAEPSTQPEWLTPRAQATMATTKYAEAEAARRAGLPMPSEEGAAPPTLPPTTPPGGGAQLPPNMFETYEEALKAAPAGWEPEITEMGYWSFRRVPQKVGATEMPGGFYKTYKEATAAAPEGFVPYQTSGGWWGYKEADKPTPAETISPYQQSYLDLQREQMGQEASSQQAQLQWQKQQAQMQQQEQQRQYGAQLMANPMSWLQYAAYTNQPPAVQPWMMPLSREKYGWKVGQPITSDEGGQELPELMTPSAQYWARMGPTAQQQYMGYSRAQSGISPEETQFRLRSGAPPSGRYSGLSWSR